MDHRSSSIGRAASQLRSPHSSNGSDKAVCSGTRTVIAKRGWLAKWTNMMKGWQKRWFVLQDGELKYCLADSADGPARGTADLTDLHIQVEHGSSRNFLLTRANSSKQAEVFARIRCQSEKERIEWITALELAKNPERPVWAPEDAELEQDGLKLRKGSSGTASRVQTPDLHGLELDSDGFSSDGDGDGDAVSRGADYVGSALLSKKMKHVLAKHQMLCRQTEALSLKLGFVPSLSDHIDIPAADLDGFVSEAGMLLGSSSEYVQGVLTYQRKWSRLLAQSAGQCDQIEEQVRAAQSEVVRLGLHDSAVK